MCVKITKHEIGDELYFILNCPLLQQEEINTYQLSYTKTINTISLKHVMSNNKHFLKRKLCLFIRKVKKKYAPQVDSILQIY